ncbi:formate--tetrahydrofolate ligase [Tunturibacter empetritectus]|uniref:Formate--tetrahydrofolate ligase n=1 Tax=Tunturiibacter empetritectus TaxID=3069691 RepID=A0A7W8MSF0_9BACT|nr:formate--tetrahydrofolate ligase [Edaphobacter lichenicola]MBB5318267.1 formate--tetrahydrofolate ligase [Edaphobacter lichenicola]
MTKDLLPIEAIVEKLNLPEKYVERLGRYGAKLTLNLLDDPTFPVRGKFILVTATTPTLSGEGKTVTSIGLVQGLEKIGKKAIITSREPSLGPVFGMKGGAAGGGRSQVEPAEKINLHFHGDFHAITSAHNLLAALIDSHLFHGNDLDLDPNTITWPRTLDMNDRALRHIIVQSGGKRDGANRHTGFLITAASEIMAIMALAASRKDLRLRLERIVVGSTRSGKPVLAKDLNATGAMMALLSEAIFPNLVQTTEGTPALVHCGPFGNIAHGTSSVLSHQMGLRLADYVINETGFASDLGFEKYMDIVMPSSGIKPSAAVLVTTVQSVRNQGAGDLEAGFENLKKHIAIVRGFNLPAIVAINRFPNDTDEDLKFLEKYCEAQGAAFALSEAFTKGGAGAAALAEKVVSVIAANPSVTPTNTYIPSASPLEKITAVAQKVYGAANVELSPQAKEKLARFTKWGYGALPVCIAKTQYSLTDDPKLMGAPTGWTLHITDVVLSAGAGFLVVISGSMMLMPGLPKSSRAMDINVDAAGEIIGMS